MKIGQEITNLEGFKSRKVSTKTLRAQLIAFSLFRLVIRSPLPYMYKWYNDWHNFSHGTLWTTFIGARWPMNTSCLGTTKHKYRYMRQ